ncbi:Neuropeptide-Like Protein [Caenorhabditis elegans]|uniref:Neuropeptide-Like Protein n=1 Tax=Caenorhabditis elegans TaxID=6239 RepID=D7SFQ0_CAEEL|nr:Neuropeptide-Like Protein [Caenorhabditis elegans]CBM41199.1 Neuropeptide-Like Protein [Caenorhabditis elegans]|eukprot:NP_001256931.1 Uncharacterized protein CELE_F26F2.11 [Caenorhabditis elegans]
MRFLLLLMLLISTVLVSLVSTSNIQKMKQRQQYMKNLERMLESFKYE